MKKLTLLIIFTLAIGVSAFAQKTDDAKDALAVVNKMFAEMANHNPAAIADVWTKESNLTAVIKRKDGTTVIHSMNGETFSKNFATKLGFCQLEESSGTGAIMKDRQAGKCAKEKGTGVNRSLLLSSDDAASA